MSTPPPDSNADVQRWSVLNIDCPTCGAKVGEACDSSKGINSNFMQMSHGARVDALRALKKAVAMRSI